MLRKAISFGYFLAFETKFAKENVREYFTQNGKTAAKTHQNYFAT